MQRLAPHALSWESNECFPPAVLREAAGVGFAGLNVPEEYGGSAMSIADTVAVFEGLGYGDPSFSGYMSVHNMCARLIANYGTVAQKASYLPRLASMDLQASYCLTEPHGGSDPRAMKTNAVWDGAAFAINGSKSFITGAGEAGLYIVACRTDNGETSLLLVPSDVAGLQFGKTEQKMGWRAQPTRDLYFTDVRVGEDALLGSRGEGMRIALSALNVGRLCIAASALGAAQWCLDRSITYCQERQTYGTLLSKHQAIRFKLADMEIQLQAARSLLRDASACIDGKGSHAIPFTATAKAFVTDAACRVIDEALQLHGGYGYLREYGIEKMLRDARVHRILEGTNEMMHVIVARSLLGRE